MIIMSLALVVGIGIVTFIAAYMLFQLGQRPDDESNKEGNEQSNKNYSGTGKHFLLQLLLLFFIAGGVLLIGKAGIDQTCDVVVVNETVSGNTTINSYDQQCFDNQASTALTFYKGTLWFVRLLFAYVFFYFLYEVLVYLGWVVPK